MGAPGDVTWPRSPRKRLALCGACKSRTERKEAPDSIPGRAGIPFLVHKSVRLLFAETARCPLASLLALIKNSSGHNFLRCSHPIRCTALFTVRCRVRLLEHPCSCVTS